MAIAAGGDMFIVAESYGNRLTAYDIDSKGDLARRRTWAEVGDDHPDGICIDAAGAVWYADVGSRRCVRVREGGDVLDRFNSTGVRSPATLSRGDQPPQLFVVCQEWSGPKPPQRPTGWIVVFSAPAPGAGKP